MCVTAFPRQVMRGEGLVTAPPGIWSTVRIRVIDLYIFIDGSIPNRTPETKSEKTLNINRKISTKTFSFI